MKINGKPFIDILIEKCISQGFRRFIVSVGYRKNQVIEHLKLRNDCEIIFSSESKQLGTGGAIKAAKKYIDSRCFFVMNGDSYIDIDFKNIINFHYKKNSSITIVGSFSEKSSDYGSIVIDENYRITSFEEKSISHNNNIINAGVYIFNRKTFDLMPSKNNFSVEKDFFSKFSRKEFYLFLSHERLFDIGTPNKLKLFQKHIESFNE